MPETKASATLPAGRNFLAQHGTTDTSVTTMTYPGTAASVSSARHQVRGLLRHSPRADEAELIAAELMSNAAKHTPSGAAGGTFTITVHRGPGRVRIEVFDPGEAAWRGVLDDDLIEDDVPGAGLAESGRGLRMVAALADECGHEVSAAGGQVCWAVVAW
jgi:anti-sigma regulatory factor (Ser/Thr protein kinase)